MLQVTNTSNAPAAIGPYSQAVEYNGILFASGQIPLDAQSGEIVGDDIKSQTTQVIKNVDGILKANDLGPENVIKTTCFLADMKDFAAFNEIYGAYFTGKPARSCVAVKELPKSVLCEIEVIAAKA